MISPVTKHLFYASGVACLLLYSAACKQPARTPSTPFEYIQNIDTLRQDVGHNNAPVISGMHASVQGRNVDIFYNVADAENEKVNVTPYYSTDGGNSYQLFEGVAGDVGIVKPGNGNKTINASIPQGSRAADISVALVAADGVPFNYTYYLSRIDTGRLHHFISRIYGIRNHITDSTHKHQVRQQLFEMLRAMGYQVHLQSFLYSDYMGQNIIARKPGYGKKAQKIVICAHYDTTTESPGADDNGSGIAGLLEVARLMADLPSETAVEFVAFDLEEFGMVGSSKYAALEQGSAEPIIAVVNMDMIGYCRNEPHTQKVTDALALAFPLIKDKVAANNYKGDFIVCIANENSKKLRDQYLELTRRYVSQRKVISILTPGNSEVVPELRYSDHSSFWDKHLPAIFISDGSDSRNPNYHTPNDRLGTLDYNFMNDAVQSVLAFALVKSNTIHGSIATTGMLKQ